MSPKNVGSKMPKTKIKTKKIEHIKTAETVLLKGKILWQKKLTISLHQK